MRRQPRQQGGSDVVLGAAVVDVAEGAAAQVRGWWARCGTNAAANAVAAEEMQHGWLCGLFVVTSLEFGKILNQKLMPK